MGRPSIDDLPLAQQKAIAIMPKFTSVLSFFSSLYIVVDVLRIHKKSMTKMYHRLLLGMSLCNCIATGAFYFTTWPIPSEDYPIWGARGTPPTCWAQSFLIQCDIGSIIYSGCLSLYYYLVILRGWTNTQLRQSNLEFAMHSMSLVFASATSVAIVCLQVANPVVWGCWIGSVPMNCRESWRNKGQTTCKKGDNSTLYQWLFFFIPLWLVIFTVTGIMLSIVCHFYALERRNHFYRMNAMGNNIAMANTLRSSCNRSDRNQELTKQSLLYVGSFYLTWIFYTIARTSDIRGDKFVGYHWMLLAAVFAPSQGIWNLVIYIRPRFQKIRDDRRCKVVLKGKQTILPAPAEVRQLSDLAGVSSYESDPGADLIAVEEEAHTVVSPPDGLGGDQPVDEDNKIEEVTTAISIQPELPTRSPLCSLHQLLSKKQSTLQNLFRDLGKALLEGDSGLSGDGGGNGSGSGRVVHVIASPAVSALMQANDRRALWLTQENRAGIDTTNILPERLDGDSVGTCLREEMKTKTPLFQEDAPTWKDEEQNHRSCSLLP